MLGALDGITLGLWLSSLEEVALGLLVEDGESLGLLPGPLDGDRVLIGASDGTTLGLWLG